MTACSASLMRSVTILVPPLRIVSDYISSFIDYRCKQSISLSMSLVDGKQSFVEKRAIVEISYNFTAVNNG